MISKKTNLELAWISSCDVSALEKVNESRINDRITELERSLENFLRYYPDTIFIDDLSEKINNAKIDKIIFDRNGYKYHGRVKALTDAVRSADIRI